MQPTLTEILITIVILALLVFFINPFMAWMPSALTYMAIGLLVVLVGIFIGFVWKERPRDEREKYHQFIAARFAYLVGVGVLALAVGVESLQRAPSVWLVLALFAMILAKLAAHFYSRHML